METPTQDSRLKYTSEIHPCILWVAGPNILSIKLWFPVIFPCINEIDSNHWPSDHHESSNNHFKTLAACSLAHNLNKIHPKWLQNHYEIPILSYHLWKNIDDLYHFPYHLRVCFIIPQLTWHKYYLDTSGAR